MYVAHPHDLILFSDFTSKSRYDSLNQTDQQVFVFDEHLVRKAAHTRQVETVKAI